jgi:group I intron endonuclease
MNRKDIVSRYKQTLPPMGIYRIKNLKNGKLFIGSAMDLRGRINRCKFQLELGSHPNRDLQRDFTEIGSKAFSFEVLDYLEPKMDSDCDHAKELGMLEQMWLEKLQPFGEKGYNKKG